MAAQIITVANQKGGVGKTTTAVTLAHGLALAGRETLLVDFDPQGQLATALRLDPEPGVFRLLVMGDRPSPLDIEDVRRRVRLTGRDHLTLLPGNSQTAAAQAMLNAENRDMRYIRDVLAPFANARANQNSGSAKLDYIVIDTSPSVGGLQERALFAADWVVVPSGVDFLSGDGTRQICETLARLQTRHQWQGQLLGILPTFHDKTTAESRNALQDLQNGPFGPYVLPPIHRATVMRECAAAGRTIFEFSARHRAAEEYGTLVQVVLKAPDFVRQRQKHLDAVTHANQSQNLQPATA